jgi:molecular chaperone DnaK
MDGKLIVGTTAKNQLAAFPDRTIASIKRRMGQTVKVSLGDQQFSPQEISAIILRRLKARAEHALGKEVTRAVITVPAFFDEDQRQATREAGALAGLQVERIINEPTAASLVYHADSPDCRHLIVYDLGGGTFDVSIVRIEGGVVEVLSSKGDTRLGGDDFDELLTKHVAGIFLSQHEVDLLTQSSTRWRLLQACERAKCQLSSLSHVRITEEFIATVDGNPVSLDVEIERYQYEELIESLVQRTIECVDEAIRDSGLTLAQLDELILVGGSTRTPLVQQRLREEFKREPQWGVNPDLAVALGAATQGAMQQGSTVGPVLIDVATHTLGIAAVSHQTFPPSLVYTPILRRNSPLPASYEETFTTVVPGQQAVRISVHQGESPHLHQNRKVGDFLLEGLDEEATERSDIFVRFNLTLDGVLCVTAVERATGLAKTLNIENALTKMSDDDRMQSAERLASMFEDSDEFYREWDQESVSRDLDDPIQDDHEVDSEEMLRFDGPSQPKSKLQDLLHRARRLHGTLSGSDAEDVSRLITSIESAEHSGEADTLVGLQQELDDLLFYLVD